jgi:ribosomal protein L16 Arg81 hydroxylase
MKNGLHFDNFDNLLHQLRGTKRALLLPPDDTPHLYYASGGTSVRLMTSDDL